MFPRQVANIYKGWMIISVKLFIGGMMPF